mgnify:CR=1 FL=1
MDFFHDRNLHKVTPYLFEVDAMFSNPGELLRLQDTNTLSRLTDTPLPDMPVRCFFLIGAPPNKATKNIIDIKPIILKQKKQKLFQIKKLLQGSVI